MIKVISWDSVNGDPAEIFRLDEAGEAARFFRQLMESADIDDIFKYHELTEEQWADAQRLGEGEE